MKILDANGANIPAFGLGTWQLRDETCSDIVSSALDAGYTHIDTAIMYENEAAVGEGVRASGKDRSDLFVTTKVWPTDVNSANFHKAVEGSLERLGMDYVDLLLIHWPPKDGAVRQWAALLNDAAERGWTRNIGVSNFTIPMLDEFMAVSDRPLAANQVENHPYLDQRRVREACARHGIAMIAYCPLYQGRPLFIEPVLQSIAEKHGKSPAQVVLRWHVQHEGCGAIPKTATVSRLPENLAVFNFSLDAQDMQQITALSTKNSRICDFEFSPEWDAA